MYSSLTATKIIPHSAVWSRLSFQLAVERMGRQSREGDSLADESLVVEHSMHQKYTNRTDQVERYYLSLLLADATGA